MASSTGKGMETFHTSAHDVVAHRWWTVSKEKLLRASATCDEQAARARDRKCYRGDDVERRVMRAERVVELGNCLLQGRRWVQWWLR